MHESLKQTDIDLALAGPDSAGGNAALIDAIPTPVSPAPAELVREGARPYEPVYEPDVKDRLSSGEIVDGLMMTASGKVVNVLDFLGQ